MPLLLKGDFYQRNKSLLINQNNCILAQVANQSWSEDFNHVPKSTFFCCFHGFIRAEVIKFNDFIHYGSEAAVKEAGKMSVEGKEYIVQDGDIMHFRFNV